MPSIPTNIIKELFMTTLRNKILILILFITLGVFLVYLFINRSSNSLVRNEDGIVVREDLIQRTTIAGTVVPFRKTIITAPYNGYIKKMYVKVGDTVKQGDPIVTVVQSLQSSDNVFPIRSPFNGIVVQVEKSEGEFIKEGDPKDFILRIDDLSKLYISANSPEIDRVKLKINQEAVIRASAILNKTYKGIIRELSLAAKEREQWGRSQVVEFPIKIEILDQDETIKPGMSVIIDVVTGKKEKVLTLRHEYIHQEKNQPFVILTSGKRQNIKTGLQNQETMEILEGVKEGNAVRKVDFTQLGKIE
jgi:multidrug efflux pump subunit AcrA (membrane-fusion protein)